MGAHYFFKRILLNVWLNSPSIHNVILFQSLIRFERCDKKATYIVYTKKRPKIFLYLCACTTVYMCILYDYRWGKKYVVAATFLYIYMYTVIMLQVEFYSHQFWFNLVPLSHGPQTKKMRINLKLWVKNFNLKSNLL